MGLRGCLDENRDDENRDDGQPQVGTSQQSVWATLSQRGAHQRHRRRGGMPSNIHTSRCLYLTCRFSESLVSGLGLALALLIWSWSASGRLWRQPLPTPVLPTVSSVLCDKPEPLVLPAQFGGVHRYSIPGEFESMENGSNPRAGVLHIYLKALRWPVSVIQRVLGTAGNASVYAILHLLMLPGGIPARHAAWKRCLRQPWGASTGCMRTSSQALTPPQIAFNICPGCRWAMAPTT